MGFLGQPQKPEKRNLYDDKEFWVGRVEEAKKRNDPFYSIFRSGPVVWKGIIDNRLFVIREKIPTGSAVLDAGCGFGWLHHHLPYMQAIKYTGVDHTPALIEYGKELYPKANLVEAPLQKLPFEDNSFAWVVCSCAKEGIVQNEENGLAPEGLWESIEKEFMRVSENAIVWPNYDMAYEILTR